MSLSQHNDKYQEAEKYSIPREKEGSLKLSICPGQPENLQVEYRYPARAPTHKDSVSEACADELAPGYCGQKILQSMPKAVIPR